MSNTDFHTSFTVDATPEAVFAAINDVRGWWSGDIEGVTDAPGGVFTYRYKDMHRSSHKIVEFVPARRIVWHVSDAALNFVADKTEDGRPAGHSFVLRGYVRTWQGKIAEEFERIGLLELIAGSPHKK